MDYLLTNNSIEILCNTLIKYKTDNVCIYSITGIIAKIIKSKKDRKGALIQILNNPSVHETLYQIIKENKCNSVVMTNVFIILHLLVDSIPLNRFFTILPMKKFKDIFCLFKLSGFDQVHEISVHLLKSIFTKKKDIEFVKPTDIEHLIKMSTSACVFLRNKFIILDFMKLGKSIFQLMTMMFNIVNLLNNLSSKQYVYQLCIENNLLEWLSEALFTLMEKQIFKKIENFFENKLDFNLINSKTIILRTLYYSILLIKEIRKYNPSSLVIFMLLLNQYIN